MKTKIFEALKTKYSNLGFNKDVLEGVATQLSAFVTEEGGIANAVVGAEAMLKTFQSFSDSRVNSFQTESAKDKAETEALKLRLAAFEKPAVSKPVEDVPQYVLDMQATMEQMKQTLTGYQTTKVSQNLTEDFIAQMGNKKVPASFYKANLIGREFKDETEMNAFAGSVASGYEAHEQELTNLGFSYTQPPEGGKPNLEKESEEMANMIAAGTKQIVEQSKN
jgi:hypothetical protein